MLLNYKEIDYETEWVRAQVVDFDLLYADCFRWNISKSNRDLSHSTAPDATVD